MVLVGRRAAAGSDMAAAGAADGTGEALTGLWRRRRGNWGGWSEMEGGDGENDDDAGQVISG
jgi:hypothetical protein